MLQGRVLILAVLFFATVACASSGDRVANAREKRQQEVERLFRDAGLAYPPKEILLRAFKHEGELELWVSTGKGQAALTKLKTYRVCAPSGVAGPKRREGDFQVPEGFYVVDRFNPQSNFHLSLGIDYPNAADRARLRGERRMGGDIFIHGSCVTVGCLPIEDGPIEELYLIALDARAAGQKRIGVHLFPSRMDDASFAALLAREKPDEALKAFWEEQLRPGYLAFEKSRRPPQVSVDPKTGRYLIKARD